MAITPPPRFPPSSRSRHHRARERSQHRWTRTVYCELRIPEPAAKIPQSMSEKMPNRMPESARILWLLFLKKIKNVRRRAVWTARKNERWNVRKNAKIGHTECQIDCQLERVLGKCQNTCRMKNQRDCWHICQEGCHNDCQNRISTVCQKECQNKENVEHVCKNSGAIFRKGCKTDVMGITRGKIIWGTYPPYWGTGQIYHAQAEKWWNNLKDCTRTCAFFCYRFHSVWDT